MNEDHALLSGSAAFVSDLDRGALRAVFARSPHAHARIGRIDRGQAATMPGVRLILTADDLTRLGLLCSPFPVAGFEAAIAAAGRPALAGDIVRHVGDPVAMVVAATEDQALDAAAALDIDYEMLPAVIGVEQALAAGAPRLHAAVPGNVALRHAAGDAAAVERLFAQAARLVAVQVGHNRLSAMALEPRAGRCSYDARRAAYEFDLPTQGPAMMAMGLAAAFKTDPAQVIVRTPHVGGSFGPKAYPYPEYLALGEAARRLGAPVFWRGTRNEAFQSDTQGRDVLSVAEAALDRDGRVIALRIDHRVDLGAYVSSVAPFTASAGLSCAAAGLYDIGAVHVTTTGVLTTSPWTDAYRGAGKPEAVLVIEQVMDAVARATGRDAAAVRRQHLIAPRQLPFKTAMGETYDSGDFPARLDQASAAVPRAAPARPGRLRGIGICCWLDVTANEPVETVRLELLRDGVRLLTGSQDTGQHHAGAFEAVVRRFVPAGNFAMRSGDSAERAMGGGTYGAKTLAVAGAAVEAAARTLRAQAVRRAADLLDCPEDDIAADEHGFRGRATNRTIGWPDLAPLAAEGTSTPVPPTYPNGCHVCAVELDPDTGAVHIVSYTAVDDFGRCLDPAAVRGQVLGGIAQGIGQALLEEVTFDKDSGQLLTGSLLDYGVPRADSLPAVSLTLVEDHPCRTNPLGVKGCGQAGAIAALGAVMGAVNDALAQAGKPRLDAPATPAKVWRAMGFTPSPRA